MNDIQKPEPAPLAHMEAATPMQMMAAVISGGVTAQNVEVFRELVAMQRDMEKHEAEKQFNAAFVALQFELPHVQKKKSVESKGVLMYRYAPFEDIMLQIAPFLKKHGFAVSFSMDFADGRIISTCTLMHVSGHSKSNKFSVRASSKPPNSSDAQGDGSNATYAKRQALSNALNIVTDDLDDDARAEGDALVTEAQADEIRRRVAALKFTPQREEQFYVWACGGPGKTFAEIPATMYAEVDKWLTVEAKKRIPV